MCWGATNMCGISVLLCHRASGSVLLCHRASVSSCVCHRVSVSPCVCVTVFLWYRASVTVLLCHRAYVTVFLCHRASVSSCVCHRVSVSPCFWVTVLLSPCVCVTVFLCHRASSSFESLETFSRNLLLPWRPLFQTVVLIMYAPKNFGDARIRAVGPTPKALRWWYVFGNQKTSGRVICWRTEIKNLAREAILYLDFCLVELVK
jgi:hypothetical protein